MVLLPRPPPVLVVSTSKWWFCRGLPWEANTNTACRPTYLPRRLRVETGRGSLHGRSARTRSNRPRPHRFRSRSVCTRGKEPSPVKMEVEKTAEKAFTYIHTIPAHFCCALTSRTKAFGSLSPPRNPSTSNFKITKIFTTVQILVGRVDVVVSSRRFPNFPDFPDFAPFLLTENSRSDFCRSSKVFRNGSFCSTRSTETGILLNFKITGFLCKECKVNECESIFSAIMRLRSWKSWVMLPQFVGRKKVQRHSSLRGKKFKSNPVCCETGLQSNTLNTIFTSKFLLLEQAQFVRTNT